jgi:hypothetical protein
VCGGSLLAHNQLADPEDEESEFVNLIRVNPNLMVVADRDAPDGEALKPRVARIVGEARQTGALLWITKGKEIENYLPGAALSAGLGGGELGDPDPDERMFPSSRSDEASYFERLTGAKSFDKPGMASRVAIHLDTANMSPRLDWKERMLELVGGG